MLTIRAARSSQYYERPEFARDDYYAERGHAPSQWIGAEAEHLGLAGAPEHGQLETLLGGLDPRTGETLPGLRRGRLNAGFDLTFTAPKSVSLLLAIGDERVREAVLGAQAAGVAAGLSYLEANELQARRGSGGARIVAAHGLVGAAYVHEMSRSGDPHLHTHAVVANAVRGADGRYSAPDMRPVYHGAKTAGTVAEAALRHELTRSLGVEWGLVHNGTAELAGIPRAVLEHFSARHAEIAELVGARGSRGLAAVGAAQRQTRDRKPVIGREVARADWRARAAEHGLGRTEIAGLLDRARADLPDERQRAEMAAALAGPKGLTERQSSFGRRDLVRALAEAHRGGAPAEWLEALADGFLADHVTPIEPAIPARGRRAAYTTPELLGVEARLLALAGERGVWAPPAPEHVERSLAVHPHLGADQRSAVRHLAGGDGRVRLLEAHAGRGKTAALAALADAHARAGVRVLGLAWQGEAAQTLHREAAIPTETAARVLHRLRRDPEALPAGAVLVVDEAATMPTRALAELAEHVAAREGRLVLVGDRAQLPSIDAGGAFAALADRVGAATLTENRRQRDPLQAAVADALAEGRPKQALALLEAHGGLSSFGGPEDARAQLIADWARAALPDPACCLILAHDRADVGALNALARAALDDAGLLGAERLVAEGREWAAGDRLVCRRNDYRPGVNVRNGTRGTVERVAIEARALTLRADDGRRIELPADYLAHAHHGYALTGHVSQGASVDRTFLLASPERGGAEWAYVAASRHRIDLRVYAVAGEPEKAAQALAATWERRQAKRLAIERLGAAERVAPAPGRERSTAVRAATTSRAESRIPAVALFAEREALAERLARGGPPSRANELRDLSQEHAAIERRRAELAALRERATARLAALGPLSLLRSGGRLERRMLRADLTSFVRQAERLDEREGPLLDSRAQARAGQEAHEAWRGGEAPALGERIAALDAELSRRADERARATERERPPYLEAALGPRPKQERPRARWREALRQLEGHRLRHGIGDPERPLGAEPADPAGRAAHRRALAGLAEARDQIERADPAGRSLPRPAGHEHRHELGPGAPGLGRDDGRAAGRREGPRLGLGR
jgi:conjugative relaxase-like TrwC/TraI family protein